MGVPARTKAASKSMKGLQHFLTDEGVRKVKLLFTDDSRELAKSAETLQLRHDSSLPYHPNMNGIAEASVRRVKEGTTAMLEQRGLSHRYWPEAMRCWCCAHNMFDQNPDGPFAGKTPYKDKCGEDVFEIKSRMLGFRLDVVLSSWLGIGGLSGKMQKM